jgi:hypothetical protein
LKPFGPMPGHGLSRTRCSSASFALGRPRLAQPQELTRQHRAAEVVPGLVEL